MFAKLGVKIVVGLFTSVAGLTLMYGVYNGISNWFQERENLRVRLTNNRIELASVKLKHEFIEKAWDNDHRTNAAVSRIRHDAELEISMARDKASKQLNMMERKEAISKASKRHSAWMTKLGNSKTLEKFDEMERIING